MRSSSPTPRHLPSAPRADLHRVRPGRFTPGPHDLRAIVIQTADPEHSACWLSTLLDAPAEATEVPLPGGPEDRIVAVVTTGPETEIEGPDFRSE